MRTKDGGRGSMGTCSALICSSIFLLRALSSTDVSRIEAGNAVCETKSSEALVIAIPLARRGDHQLASSCSSCALKSFYSKERGTPLYTCHQPT